MSKIENYSNTKKFAIKGIKWSYASSIVVAVMGLLTQIIKARFLNASEFGILAGFYLIYGFVLVLESSGIKETIIQKDELINIEKFTLFLFVLLVGLLLSILLFFLSNFFEKLLNFTGLAITIKLSSPLAIFGIMNTYFKSLLSRSLHIKSVTLIGLIGHFFNFIAMILFLYLGFGYYSIIFALLINKLIEFIFSIFFIKRKKISFLCSKVDYSILKYYIHYGVNISFKEIFSHVIYKVDEVLISIFFTQENLGMYFLAKESLAKIRRFLNLTFKRVLLPVFSRLNYNERKLYQVYRSIIIVVTYVSCSIFLGFFIISNKAVPIIFGENWIQSVFPFQMFSLAMIPLIINVVNINMFYSLGKTSIVLYIEIIASIGYILFLIILGRFGINYILYVYTIYCYIKSLVLQLFLGKKYIIKIKQMFYLQLKVLLRVLAMLIFVSLINTSFNLLFGPIALTIIQIFAGIISIIVIIKLTDEDALRYFKLLLWK